MKHVVMFSGGIGSWAAAKRVAERHDTADMVLLFTDTLIEDADLYRFIEDAAANVGAPVTRIAEGRDPWQVFHDSRYLGNSQLAKCSSVLKREMAREWVTAHCDPASTTIHLGLDWTEQHRIERNAESWLPWVCEAPLAQKPYLSKLDLFDWARREGLELPRLYRMGFSHNNCGGFCVKAGQGHFARLLRQLPDVYAHHEAKEQELRDYLGKDVAIMKDRTGAGTKPLTMREFRERLQAGTLQADMCDIGGCGCFSEAA
jgi:3'-phosphoadenosine 5'-phosphosulfate sulfotransferase (PAPS reductase)/FAD synthetase